MKRVVLVMDEEAYRRVANAMTVRLMSGVQIGAPDALVGMLLDAIESGQEEVRILRNKPEKELT